MSLEPIATLIKWFLPLLIRSDEDTYSEIAKNAKGISPAGVAVVMALWKAIVHRFTESGETNTLLSNLQQPSPSSDLAKILFFEKLGELFDTDQRFATTLDYLYHSSEGIDAYVQGYIRPRLPGDVSTDAPPPPP